MEVARHTPAIILNRQSYRENDSLVVIYSLKYGKERLAARGTKKLHSKLAGHLEPLSLVDVMILEGKSGLYLGSAITRDAYLEIKADLNKIYYAGRALSWFNNLVKDREADEKLFFLLGEWLEIVNNYLDLDQKFSKERGELFLVAFWLKLLTTLGYSLQLQECLDCHKKIKAGENYFNLVNGGLICRDCALILKKTPSVGLLPISDDSIKLLRFLGTNKFDQIKKIQITAKQSEDLLKLGLSFLRYHFEH